VLLVNSFLLSLLCSISNTSPRKVSSEIRARSNACRVIANRSLKSLRMAEHL
jgi:hypothetical protein